MIALYIFIAGGTGALLRWGLSRLISFYFPTFPLGIMLCNLVGCFFIGFCAGLFHKPSTLSISLMVGLLGGFTTFSSFALDSVHMIENGKWGALLYNTAGSLILGMLCCFAGLSLALMKT